MHVVFDLDGVMLDTAELIKGCYQLAGAHPPDDVLAFEGVNWIEQQVGTEYAARVRLRKNALYRQVIETGIVHALPGLDAARRLYSEGHEVTLLTGAPPGTIDAFRRGYFTNDWPFGTAFDNVRTPSKMKVIAEIGGTGVYVDDQSTFIDLPSRWRFIHYTGQDVAQLLADIKQDEG